MFRLRRESRRACAGEGRPVRSYVIQNLKSDLGETASARLISPRDGGRVVELTGTEPVIRPEDGVVYECGELSRLTLTDVPAKGSFLVIFRSGQTAAVLTVPQSLKLPEGFSVAANTRCELHVRDGYALAGSWAVSGR